jgi:hypothetical protein
MQLLKLTRNPLNFSETLLKLVLGIFFSSSRLVLSPVPRYGLFVTESETEIKDRSDASISTSAYYPYISFISLIDMPVRLGGGGRGFWRPNYIPFSYRPGITGTDLTGTQGHSLVGMMMAGDGDFRTFRVGGHRWYLAVYPAEVHESSGAYVSVGLRRVDDLLRCRPSGSPACTDDFVKMEDLRTMVHPMEASTATMTPYIC